MAILIMLQPGQRGTVEKIVQLLVQKQQLFYTLSFLQELQYKI